MTLNLLAPDVTENPYPFYAELRRRGPVVQIEPGGMWAISRYDDAITAIRDVERFSSAGVAKAYEPPWLGRNPVAHSMVSQDPPRHGALRRLVDTAFSVQATSRIEGALRATAEELADDVVRRGEVDFMADYAEKLPVAALGHLIGLPLETWPKVRPWLASMAAITGARTPEQQEQIRASVVEMSQHLGDLIESARSRPREGFLGDLIRAEIDGVALTHDEIVSFLFLLMGAGMSSTVHLLGNMMNALAAHPQEAERARVDPRHAARIIEEVCRWDAPVRALFRTARAGAEVYGVPVPEGARVVVLVGAANRDERRFKNAERFMPDRERQSHLGFGEGIHFCLGPALARLEARFALNALLARTRSFTVKPEGVVWEPGVSMRGPKVLPIELHPAVE